MQNIICRKSKKEETVVSICELYLGIFFYYKLMDKDSIQFLLKFI